MISTRAARRATFVAWGFTLALLLGGMTLTVMNRSTVDLNTASLYGVFALAAFAFSTVGGLIARRQASNSIGWLFCLIALAFAALPFSQEYAIRGRYLFPGSLPAADWFGFATDWPFFLILGPIALVFLLFPAGRPLSPRWRIAVWAAGVSGALFAITDALSKSTAGGTGGDRLTNHGGAVPNPIGILSSNAAAGGVIGQNVAKYAEASRATVRLHDAGGELTFGAEDDGRGLDPDATGYGTGLQGIADRLAAVGGEIQVTSTPGRGTSVVGRLPVEGSL